MKLELKHLAAYLPFELKVLTKFNKIKTLKPSDLETNYIFGKFKLILKPISFLKKDKKLLDILAKKLSDVKTSIYSFESSKMWILEVLKDENATALPFFLTEILLKNHFDIFGLIDAGLAVDINCL